MTRDYRNDLDVIVLANNYSAAMVGDINEDVLAMARGAERKPPAWRADVPLAPSATALAGTWRLEQSGPPLGPMAFGLERRGETLVATLGGQPFDTLLPQGDGRYLARALWSELKAAGDSLTMRALWLDRPPARLVRVTP
jgi:hypothetical protein